MLLGGVTSGVKALREFKRPVTKKELKSYLGMLGYYRRFIPGFSSVALPLTEVTNLKSPSKLHWTNPMQHAFGSLRDALCEHTRLTIPSPEDCFVLATDASGKGIGAVLSVTRAGIEQPVAYFSRKLRRIMLLRSWNVSRSSRLSITLATIWQGSISRSPLTTRPWKLCKPQNV